MDSILTSIKKSIGISEEYDHFDNVIIMGINSAFVTLNQLGVGPEQGYVIEDKNNIWSEFIGDTLKLETVKPYMSLKVKLFFDPPNNSSLIDAMNRQASELEWRIKTQIEIDSTR